MGPEEEPQELATRQQQALPKSCFSVTLCTPVLPVWPLLTQTSCLGSCPCTPLWGQAGEAGNGWRNSSRACVCLRVGGKGQAGKAKPGRSHRARGQAGASWSSALLPHRSNVAGERWRFLNNSVILTFTILLSQCQNSPCKWPAEQTLPAQQSGRAGHFSPHLPRASPRLANKPDQDVQPSRAWSVFNRRGALKVLNAPHGSARPLSPAWGTLGATVEQGHTHGGTEHEPARAQGPGNVQTRFLSSQQGRWTG